MTMPRMAAQKSLKLAAAETQDLPSDLGMLESRHITLLRLGRQLTSSSRRYIHHAPPSQSPIALLRPARQMEARMGADEERFYRLWQVRRQDLTLSITGHLLKAA